MKATKRLGAGTLAGILLLCLAPVSAQESAPWVHIDVTEEGDKPSKVRVNLPLSVVEAAVEVAPAEMAKKIAEGRLKLENTELSVADLRRLWQELRAAGDAELVSVEDGNQRVRIARQGDRIFIHVDEAGEGKESKVRIEAPVSVVDALLEGEGQELNLRAAIRRLREQRGELVRVQDGSTQVRIWIDASS